ncbi:hypothetical Protein YC6258_04031 [Gynuella sunshinyii YC6258]|uniref:Uncharacterized protein n=1 Tax=Gynuella sunshinyii YC6258 TaxID=1445510 RepID=A0A0C5VMW2_9GAMM|nr:hypothetical Protein YC6258_04031 [Gynuella sunshinyii YC6258]
MVLQLADQKVCVFHRLWLKAVAMVLCPERFRMRIRLRHADFMNP